MLLCVACDAAGAGLKSCFFIRKETLPGFFAQPFAFESPAAFGFRPGLSAGVSRHDALQFRQQAKCGGRPDKVAAVEMLEMLVS